MDLAIHLIAGVLAQVLEKALVDEDEAVMSRGLRMSTKQELQELEGHINYASFLLAAGVSMPQPIDNWISEARKTAFCLADQIAMYAIRGSSLSQLYHMKDDIGMLRIGQLTDKVKFHKHVGEKNGQMPAMPQISYEGLPQLSKMSLFIRGTRSVPNDAIIRMDERKKRVEDFFAGPHSVLFITGGQGSGKTTLMKDVYASEKGKIENVRRKGKHKLEVEQGNEPNKKDFDQCCWVDIAETGELVALLKMVLKELNVDCDSIHEFEIINMVHDNFKANYCLMVLDNVEDTSVLYSLMKILKGLKCKIVCLTRRYSIQEEVDQDVFPIPGLEPYDSLKLFLSAAFYKFHSTTVFPRENFNSIVRDGVLREAVEWKAPSLPVAELLPMVNLLNAILIRCQNNPWNIWSIGSVLAANPPDKWKKIMEPIDGMLIDGNKLYEKCDPPVQLEDAKLADATIRHCLLYCLAFPQTSESETLENSGGIPTRKLIRLWEAEGCVENSQNPQQDAECALEDLIKKNLLVVKKKGFDGEVLKCSVNEHIRPLAEKMCEHQKFCKVVVKEDDDASASSRMTKCFPINPNMRIRRKKPLSDRYRMLAVHGDGGVKELSKTLGKDIRLRSLLHFKTGVEHPELELTFHRTCMLLRTLELQGANVGKLPPNIDCLVCLRYLGLRGNKLLETLPPTLQRLTHLMCLDIRDTGIQELVDVSKFEEMRHLYLTNSFRSHSVAVREGLHWLEHLQTLSGATYGNSSDKISFEDQISHLAGCLRKLSVKKILASSSKLFCETINRFKHLQSLAISCDGDLKKFDLSERDSNKFNLSDLKIGKNLRKLKLGGPMLNLFHLGDKMQSITYLYLWDSTWSTDLLVTLNGLINLLVLSLVNASMSKEMICYDIDGYQKLKKLSIISMDELSVCEFHGNSMASLEELVVAKCGNLKKPPQRLDQLRSLQEVHLTGMPPEFCDKAKHKLRDKVYVLPDALSHVVPSKPATGGGI